MQNKTINLGHLVAARRKAAEKYPELSSKILAIGSYKQFLTIKETI